MSQLNQNSFKYDAFISYRHIEPDITVAGNVHRILEGYRIPANIAKKTGRKRFRRVFRDQDELPVSEDLSNDILHALENSQFLIVICSKNTPKSKWCMREIEIFKKIRGEKYILTLLIDGEPSESFPNALRFVDETITDKSGKVIAVSREIEPLAADIRQSTISMMLRKLKKYEILRIIAPMLEVGYDALRQRHRERFMKRIIAAALSMILFLGIFGSIVLTQYLQNIRLSGDNNQLTLNMIKAKNDIKSAQAELDAKKKEITAAADELEKSNMELNASKADISKKQIQLKQLTEENDLGQQELKKTLSQIKEQKLAGSINYAEAALNSGDRMKASLIAMNAVKGFADSKSNIKSYEEAERILSMATYDPRYESYAVLKNDDRVNDCIFSSDDKFLFTASNDGTASMWEVQNGEKQKDFLHSSSVTAVCLNGDNTALFTSTADNQVIEWDVGTGKQLKKIPDFQKLAGQSIYGITKIFYNRCDKNIYILGSYYEKGVSRAKMIIACWNSDKDTTRIISRDLSAVGFSEDGNYIAMASWSGEIILKDVKKKNTLVKKLPDDYIVNQIKFNKDNGVFFTTPFIASDLIFWDMRDLEITKQIPIDNYIVDMSVSPDGKYLGICLYDGDGFIYDANSGDQIAKYYTEGSPIIGICFLNNQYFLTSATFSGKLLDVWKLETLYDGNSKELKTKSAVHVTTMTPPESEIARIRLSNREKVLAAASIDGRTKLYHLDDPYNMEIIHRKIDDLYKNGTYSNEDIVTDITGTKQLVTSEDKPDRIFLRDAATGKNIKEFKYDVKHIYLNSASPNFKYAMFAFVNQEGKNCIINTENGRILKAAVIPANCQAIAIDNDADKAVVMTSNLKTLQIDLSTGKVEKEVSLQVDIGAIATWKISVDFDQRRLIAIGTYPRSTENVAFVFQLDTGKMLFNIYDPELWSNYIATIDGKKIMAENVDSTDVWTLKSFDEILIEAKRQLNGRTLTMEELKECNLDS